MDINNLTFEEKVSILREILYTEDVCVEADEHSFTVDPDSITYSHAENKIVIMES